MKNIVRVKYTGATPGADASTYTLFSTVTAFPGANYCAMGGLGRLVLALANSAAGTLKGYVSEDRGINWTQILPDTAVSARTAGNQNPFDIRIGEYPDFKLDWVNGGSAQTTWLVEMALYPLGVPTV